MAFNPDPKPEPRKKEGKGEKDKKYKCRFCKKHYFMKPSEYGRRSMTVAKKTCTNPDCMILAWKDHKKKQAEKEKKDWNKRKKEEKIKSKNLTNWKDDLQKEINWIVKKLDENRPCISHPTRAVGMRYDAGHYFSVASSGDLRFNVHNIHKQGSYANTNFGGCPAYLIGLSNRYDKNYADYVQYDLGNIYRGISKEKITIDNIRNIYLPNARRVKREIEKGADFTRDQVNTLIGIYLTEYGKGI